MDGILGLIDVVFESIFLFILVCCVVGPFCGKKYVDYRNNTPFASIAVTIMPPVPLPTVPTVGAAAPAAVDTNAEDLRTIAFHTQYNILGD